MVVVDRGDDREGQEIKNAMLGSMAIMADGVDETGFEPAMLVPQTSALGRLATRPFSIGGLEVAVDVRDYLALIDCLLVSGTKIFYGC